MRMIADISFMMNGSLVFHNIIFVIPTEVEGSAEEKNNKLKKVDVYSHYKEPQISRLPTVARDDMLNNICYKKRLPIS